MKKLFISFIALACLFALSACDPERGREKYLLNAPGEQMASVEISAG